MAPPLFLLKCIPFAVYGSMWSYVMRILTTVSIKLLSNTAPYLWQWYHASVLQSLPATSCSLLCLARRRWSSPACPSFYGCVWGTGSWLGLGQHRYPRLHWTRYLKTLILIIKNWILEQYRRSGFGKTGIFFILASPPPHPPSFFWYSSPTKRREVGRGGGRVADPDSIRIQSGQWIRIRIRNPDPDPDPGGKNEQQQ